MRKIIEGFPYACSVNSTRHAFLHFCPNSYTLIKFSEVKHNTAIEDSVFDPPGSPQR
jgi:hypothetical protein